MEAQRERRVAWFSPVLLAILSPALLQPVTCSETQGNTKLATLELEISRKDRLVDFSPSRARYAVATTSETAVVRARAEDPAARLTYVYWRGEEVVRSGELGGGSGEATLDPPLGLSAIRVYVRTPEGPYAYYEIEIDRSPKWPCDEQGIRNAIASRNDGPQTFDCDGPTTVATQAEIVVNDDAILDGEGNLTLEGRGGHRIFFIPAGRTAELVGMELTNGRAEYGGGIYNLGSATVVGVRVSSNEAELGGGGVYSGPGSELFLDGVTVDANSASGLSEAAGGGLYLEDSTAFIANSLIESNVARGYGGQSGRRGRGGGLFVSEGDLVVEASRIALNSAIGGDATGELSGAGSASGGGLYLASSATIITDSAVSGNVSQGGLGPVGGGFGGGGGIWQEGGSVLLERATIDGNIADGMTGPYEAGEGGGLKLVLDARFVAVNSTISGNRADFGEALQLRIGAIAAFFGSTIAFNSTDESRSALLMYSGTQLEISHTIIANAGTCVGSVLSHGYNVLGPGFGCAIEGDTTGNQTEVDPQLLPLADNGGPTITHALHPGSVAVDRVPSGRCLDASGETLTTDQRGEPRPSDAACDAGAYEVHLVACTEQGIRDAIVEGGGPHFFDCNGPTTVVTEAEIEIDTDVVLDGRNALTVDGNDDHCVFHVLEGAAVELHRLTIANGSTSPATGSPAGGGCVRNYGSLTLNQVRITSCHSNSTGGGIGNFLTDAELTVTDSVISDNTSEGGGGGIDNTGTVTLTDSTVSDNMATRLSARGGGINSIGPLTLMGSTVSGNSTGPSGLGGGFFNADTATLTDSLVFGNTGIHGGGFFNTSAATLTLIDTAVSGNGGYTGGGIDNFGKVTLIDSTVSANTATTAGGGIANGISARLKLTNSTVSDNAAGDSGGGIWNNATVVIAHGTVSGNTAVNSGSGIYNDGNSTLASSVTLASSILDGDCFLYGGEFISNGYNIESPGDTCGFDQPTDQVDASSEALKLGPLQDNGGHTMTHALRPGSVAIDVIPAEACLDGDGVPMTTDQRGSPRDSMCDVGAFEVQP
jgi:hypothetical protein